MALSLLLELYVHTGASPHVVWTVLFLSSEECEDCDYTRTDCF